jgi:hypothetical protein
LLEVVVAAEHKVAGILNTWESPKTGRKVAPVVPVGGEAVIMAVEMEMVVRAVLRTMRGFLLAEM